MLRTIYSSLRFGLILLTLSVLVPAVWLLVYDVYHDRETAQNEEKSKVLYLARLAAAEESQLIQSTHNLLQQLAQTPDARGETSRAACDEMMAQQIKPYPHYYNLGVIGINGIRFCSVLTPGRSIELSTRLFFRRTVETREFSVGNYQIGASNGKPGITFGYPVIDAAGALQAVVYAVLNLDWFDKSLARTQLPAEAVMSVVDSRGNVLARFPQNDSRIGMPIPQTMLKLMLAQGDSGTFEGIGASGIRRVWGFVQLQPTASGMIFVRVGMPVAVAYARINRKFHKSLLLIAATALLIMIVAWAFGEQLIMKPVKRLTEAARHVGKGDLSARTGLPHGDGELGQLARVFDDMAGSIQSEEAVLGQVMERQKDANEKLVAGMDELGRLNREITQLGLLNRALQASQSVEEACAAIMQSGQILFPSGVAALYLLRPSSGALEYKAGWGGTGDEKPVLAPDSCWALRRHRVYRFEPRHSELPCAHVSAEPATPYICVPLIAQNDTLGLLHVRFPAPGGANAAGLIESRLQLATTFADQAALALSNLNLREALKDQAIRDPLTNLYNRRFLEETLERELARAQRKKAPLALIMADVDHFKRINDTYGHDAGDAVLRSVADVLKSSIRGSDIACRFGGEEFTLVLPESAPDAAREKAESLRRTIATLALSHAGQAVGTVTMSFGLAIFPEHGNTKDELIRAADKALYEAKRAGRNRVAVASPRTVPSPVA